jgi:hypothetical protein
VIEAVQSRQQRFGQGRGYGQAAVPPMVFCQDPAGQFLRE